MFNAPSPHSNEAEAAVCNWIGERGSRALTKYALTPEHFFDHSRRLVVETWCELRKAGSPIDIQSVSIRLRERGLLGDKAGGINNTRLLGVYSGKVDMNYEDPFNKSDGDRLSLWREYNDNPAEWCAMLEKLRQLRAIRAAAWQAWSEASETMADPLEVRGRLRAALAGAESRVNASVTSSAIDEIRAMLVEREVGGSIAIPTGVAAWDKALHGIFPRRFYAIGARPKVGKSALIEQITKNLHDAGVATLIFQRDMSVTDMIGRIACRSAGMVFEDFMAGELSPAQSQAVRSAVTHINPDLLRVYSPTNLTAVELAMIVEREAEQFGVKAFFLDLFQRLKVGKDKVEGLVDAANTVREVIHNTGVPGIVLAEVTKESDKTGGRPHSGQFKYCDGLFSSCDTSIMLWSDDDPKDLVDEHSGEHRRQSVWFTVDANRGGAVSDERMFFDRPTMRFFSTEDGRE